MAAWSSLTAGLGLIAFQVDGTQVGMGESLMRGDHAGLLQQRDGAREVASLGVKTSESLVRLVVVRVAVGEIAENGLGGGELALIVGLKRGVQGSHIAGRHAYGCRHVSRSGLSKECD